jgi:hypothetical protein
MLNSSLVMVAAAIDRDLELRWFGHRDRGPACRRASSSPRRGGAHPAARSKRK